MALSQFRTSGSVRGGARRAGGVVLVVVVAVLGLLASAVVAGAAPQAPPRLTAAYQEGTPAAESMSEVSWPLYTDPRWYPLRDPAEVSCSYRNCNGGSYHPYWAVDLKGQRGDPIYPAGAGVAHVTDASSSCRPKGSAPDTASVWVDHGGGVFTKYNHFTRVLVESGQRVTPTTMLGTMGHSGSEPCESFYLHYEERLNSIRGDTHQDPGHLRICSSGEQGLLPRAVGYESWAAMPTAYGAREVVSSDGALCWPVSKTPSRPSISSVTHGTSSITVRWPLAPPAVDRVAVSMRIFHKSSGNFGPPEYRRLADTATRTTFTGLRSGRPYQFRVAFHNVTGWSPWSPTRQFMFPRQ